MGLGDAEFLDDGEGGGKASAAAVPCSICLDMVTDDGDRSRAKLQCGHQFHLDCIGSAFNIKGAMQCPNCRKVEKGRWLYANGGRQLPEFSMDDWTHDEDPYDLSYSDMSFGVHWCPFSGLTRLPSSYDEGEFLSSAYHDLLGHHTIFAEHAPIPSTTHHPCPYVAYFGPIHPSSTSNGNLSDGPSFNNHWSGLSAPIELPNSYPFPTIDTHYHNWDHSSHFAASNRIGSADQPPQNPDIPRPGMNSFIVGHSSGVSRAPTPSSMTSSVIPPYPGPVDRVARDRPPSLQGYFQQSTSAPVARTSHVSAIRRPSSHRGLPQVTENAPRFPMGQVDRESIWAAFHHPSAGGSNRPSSFWPRQNHRT